MAHSKFIGPAFRLQRTLDLLLDHGHRKLPVRVEFFQNPAQPKQFRYRAWCLEWFKLQPGYHDEPLLHELWTTLCLPNFGAGDFFEAVDLDAAEKSFLRILSANRTNHAGLNHRFGADAGISLAFGPDVVLPGTAQNAHWATAQLCETL